MTEPLKYVALRDRSPVYLETCAELEREVERLRTRIALMTGVMSGVLGIVIGLCFMATSQHDAHPASSAAPRAARRGWPACVGPMRPRHRPCSVGSEEVLD